MGVGVERREGENKFEEKGMGGGGGGGEGEEGGGKQR